MARRHPHRGHKLSAAARRKISTRERGRHHVIRHHAAHHRGHKLTAAERHKISARLRGRHHHTRRHLAHRKGHKMTAAERAKLSARLRGRHHPHRGVKRRHVHRSLRRGNAGPVHQPRTRRGRIYPSHFKHGRNPVRSRFNHHKRVRSLRAPFVAGRRHVRAWK